MTTYKTTKEQCEKQIHGVCEGCGGKLEALETVDNSGDPTFWVGCNHCSCFRGGVEKRYFRVAQGLIESGEYTPYSSMRKCDYEDSPERLAYYLDTQTAEASWLVRRIDKLLTIAAEVDGGEK